MYPQVNSGLVHACEWKVSRLGNNQWECSRHYFHKVLDLCVHRRVVMDCRMALSTRLYHGSKLFARGVLPSCSHVSGCGSQVCGEYMLDWEPRWGCPSSLCRNAARCLCVGQAAAPFALPAAPAPVGPVTSVPARANPKPCCCAYTRQDHAGCNRQSRSEWEKQGICSRDITLKKKKLPFVHTWRENCLCLRAFSVPFQCSNWKTVIISCSCATQVKHAGLLEFIWHRLRVAFYSRHP